MATDEEVNKRQAEIAALQLEAQAARLDAVTANREQDNDVLMAQMDAEEARLKAQIEEAKALSNAKAVRAATADQVDAVLGEPTEKYGKGVEVQTLADGSVHVLSIKGDEPPDVPDPVTTDTVPEPTPDPVPEPKSTRRTAAKE